MAMMSPWPNMMPGIQNEVATATAAMSTELARPATTVSTNDMAICAIWPRKTGTARKARVRASCPLKCLNMMLLPGGEEVLRGREAQLGIGRPPCFEPHPFFRSMVGACKKRGGAPHADGA